MSQPPRHSGSRSSISGLEPRPQRRLEGQLTLAAAIIATPTRTLA
jgi:hypothetical protein